MRGKHVFSHPDPEIERLANKHYQEDPITRKQVDDLIYGTFVGTPECGSDCFDNSEHSGLCPHRTIDD